MNCTNLLRCRFAVILISIASPVFASDPPVKFYLVPDSQVTLTVSGSDLIYEISSSVKRKQGRISVDTEKFIHIDVDDYNFSGSYGFSMWYTDAGIGIYTIHRVFVFSPKIGAFVEQFPKCGDEFINLTVDRKGRRLLSTYFPDNVPRICATTLPKYRN